jgi:hypothetical protein
MPAAPGHMGFPSWPPAGTEAILICHTGNVLRDQSVAREPAPDFIRQASVTLVAFVSAVREFWRGYTQGPPGS